MTIQQSLQVDEFKQQLRDSLRNGTLNSQAVKVARHVNVYSCGDQDEMVYFIESGQIKLHRLSSESKRSLVPIHGAGDSQKALFTIRLQHEQFELPAFDEVDHLILIA